MSTKLFVEAAELLWGKQFQKDAARHLGIARSSVQRYAHKENPRPVPDKVLEKMAALLDERRDEITKILPKVTP